MQCFNVCEDVVTVVLSLGFFKAFDSVSHELLLRKLSSGFGFSTSAVQLVQSYLSDRFPSVSENGFDCRLLSVTCRATQGSVEGPL